MAHNPYDDDGWTVHRVSEDDSRQIEIVPIYERARTRQEAVPWDPEILLPGPINSGRMNRHTKQINRISQGTREAARRSFLAASDGNVTALQTMDGGDQNSAADICQQDKRIKTHMFTVTSDGKISNSNSAGIPSTKAEVDAVTEELSTRERVNKNLARSGTLNLSLGEIVYWGTPEDTFPCGETENANLPAVQGTDSELYRDYRSNIDEIAAAIKRPQNSSKQNARLTLPSHLHTPQPRVLTHEELPGSCYSIYGPSSGIRGNENSVLASLSQATPSMHQPEKQTQGKPSLAHDKHSVMNAPNEPTPGFQVAKKTGRLTPVHPQTKIEPTPYKRGYTTRVHKGRYGLDTVASLVNDQGVSEFRHQAMEPVGDLIDFSQDWEVVCHFKPYNKPLPLVDWVRDGPNDKYPIQKWTHGDQRLFPSKPVNLLEPLEAESHHEKEKSKETAPVAVLGSYLTHNRPIDHEQAELDQMPAPMQPIKPIVKYKVGKQPLEAGTEHSSVCNDDEIPQETVKQQRVDPFARNNPFANGTSAWE